MVTKILALLDNPILRDTFRKVILKALDAILNEFENNLLVQKRLLDEVLLTIENQISIEEFAQTLEIQFETLAKEEEKLKVHLNDLKASAEELAKCQRKLEFLSLGLDHSKITVEA